MWIKEPPEDYKTKSSYFDKVVFLWKSEDVPVYVSDNHLIAAWCWMQECKQGEVYNFMHIDRHSDLKGYGHPGIIDSLSNNQKLSFEEYCAISYNNGNTFPLFQWNNYIRACHHIFPEWFNTNYFYVHDSISADDNLWGYKAFPFKKRNPIYVREDISQFIDEISEFMGDGPEGDMWKKPWIVNLDLDFFGDGNMIRIFDNLFICDFARRLKRALRNIKVLTIALSPECVGGDSLHKKWENAVDVLNIFKEELNLNISLGNN